MERNFFPHVESLKQMHVEDILKNFINVSISGSYAGTNRFLIEQE